MDEHETPGAIGRFQTVRTIGSDPGETRLEALDLDRGLPVEVRLYGSGAPGLATGILEAANAAAGVHHPNVVAVLESGTLESGGAFVAMEHVDGESLPAYLARVGKLPPMHGLALALQLFSALEAAHGQGLVHGALRPDQLLVTHGGSLKVGGFGVLRAGDGRGAQEDLAYLAPEQLLDEAIDARTDLYAASVVVYELLTGVSPFQVPGTGGPTRKGPGFPPSVARPGLPVALDAVFDRALAQAPGLRFQSAGELSAAVQAAMGSPVWDRPEPALKPKSPARRAIAWPTRAHPRNTPARSSRTRVLGAAAASFASTLLIAAVFHQVWNSPTVVKVAAAPPLNVADAATLSRSEVIVEEAAPAAAPAPAPGPAVAAAPPLAPAPAPALASSLAAPRSTAAAPPTKPEPLSPPAPTRPPEGVAAPPVAAVPAERPAPSHSHARRDPESGPVPIRSRVHAVRHTEPARAGNAPQRQCKVESDLARELCVAYQCAKTEFRHHPVCVRMHADARTRHILAERPEGP